MRRPLPLLALLFSSVDLHAQSAVNLQPAQIPLLPAAIPVDLAVIRNATEPRPRLLVATQGTNTVYDYYAVYAATPHTFFRNSLNYPAPQPLSILPVRLANTTTGPMQDFVVLTADGNVAPWRFTTRYANEPLVALRNGLACAPTDRLVTGKYFLGGGSDLACWSNGPSPGIARARNLGTGAFQPQSRVLSNPGTSPPTVMVTANMCNSPDQLEDALMALPNETAPPRFTFWRHSAAPSMASSWFSVLNIMSAYTNGACTCLAAGDVDGDGVLEVATAGANAFVVKGGCTVGSYSFSSPDQTLALPSPGIARDVRFADLTGDNRPELLVLSDDGVVSVFENVNGATPPLFYNFTPSVYLTGLDPALLRVADADSDGDLDVLIPCRGDHSITVLWNNRIALGTRPAAGATPEVRVYPAPATTVLHLQWTGLGTGPVTAELLDVMGRRVREWSPAPPEQGLEVADLDRGVYLLRVTGASGTVTRRVTLH